MQCVEGDSTRYGSAVRAVLRAVHTEQQYRDVRFSDEMKVNVHEKMRPSTPLRVRPFGSHLLPGRPRARPNVHSREMRRAALLRTWLLSVHWAGPV